MTSTFLSVDIEMISRVRMDRLSLGGAFKSDTVSSI